MTLAAEVTAELTKGATGADVIARRIGADEGLVHLVLRRLDRDGTLSAPVLSGGAGGAAASACGPTCGTGADAGHASGAVASRCGACPLLRTASS